MLPMINILFLHHQWSIIQHNYVFKNTFLQHLHAWLFYPSFFIANLVKSYTLEPKGSFNFYTSISSNPFIIQLFSWRITLLYRIYGLFGLINLLFGLNNLLFVTINSWKVHPQSIIFCQASVMEFLIFSKSSKSLLDI